MPAFGYGSRPWRVCFYVCFVHEKVRFILAVVEERLQVNNRKKSDLLKELKEEGYDLFLPP